MSCWHTVLGATPLLCSPLAARLLMTCDKLVQALFDHACLRSVRQHHTTCITAAFLDQLYLVSAAFASAQELFQLPQAKCQKPQGKFQRPQDKCKKPQGKCIRPQGKCIRPQGKFQRPQGKCKRPQVKCKRLRASVESLRASVKSLRASVHVTTGASESCRANAQGWH